MSQFPLLPPAEDQTMLVGTGDPQATEGLLSSEPDTEYLVVSDKTSEVILSSGDLGECRKLATKIRKCGGEVTLFKSLKF